MISNLSGSAPDTLVQKSAQAKRLVQGASARCPAPTDPSEEQLVLCCVGSSSDIVLHADICTALANQEAANIQYELLHHY